MRLKKSNSLSTYSAIVDLPEPEGPVKTNNFPFFEFFGKAEVVQDFESLVEEVFFDLIFLMLEEANFGFDVLGMTKRKQKRNKKQVAL